MQRAEETLEKILIKRNVDKIFTVFCKKFPLVHCVTKLPEVGDPLCQSSSVEPSLMTDSRVQQS